MFFKGYAVYLAEFIMNQSFDLALRQLACIMLTRYVEEYWDVETETYIEGGCASEQAKKTIRNILPNGLYDPNSKIRTAVAHTISTIAQTDWPTIWTELFDIIIKCLGNFLKLIYVLYAYTVYQIFVHRYAEFKFRF